MCTPIAIGGAMVAGGIVKGIGDKISADARADASDRNAIIAEDAASEALQKGTEDAGRIQMQGAAMQGAQRAGYGASGVDVNQGSAARTQEDTAMLTAMDKQTARNNAQREAWGLEKQAGDLRQQASSERSGGFLALGGDIIGAGAQAASMFTAPKAKAPGK